VSQGFDPDVTTLSQNLNVSAEQVVEMQQRMDGSDVSLDAPTGSEENPGASRIELLPALGAGIEDLLSDNEISHLVRERIAGIIPLLSEKEAYILESRLLTDDPVTLREIGEKYGVTRERVRQIEARLLQKVRDYLFKEIKDFSRDWIVR
jgi:RNA polymerase sigma-32 factor